MTITDLIADAIDRSDQTVGDIDPELIHPNPWQTRVTIDLDGIEALAADVEVNGLLQPILVRPIQHGRRYELVFGQRRLRAIQLLISRDKWFAGIPAQIREMSDREVFMATIGENTSREDVNTVEESMALARALDEIEDLSQAELAKTLGISASQLSNRLRILKLPDGVLDKVRSGVLPWTAARALLVLVGPDSHVHGEEIADALAMAERWSNANKDPNITVRTMREAIVTRCANQPRKWRPMEPIKGFEGKPVSASPEFDVAAFLEKHRETLHTIPSLRSTSGGNTWTCNGREWMRLQRAARVAAKVDGRVAMEPSAERDRWVDAILEHPLVQQVAPEFSRENPVFTPEQAERLGTLSQYVRVAERLDFAVEMATGYGGPPEYLDQSECRSTCTQGAIIANHSSWSWQPELHCTNQHCFKTKLLEGKEKLRTEIVRTVERDDARQGRLADRLTPYLADPGLARGLGRLLADTLDPKPVTPSNLRGDEDLNYYPAAMRRAAEVIGLEVRSTSPIAQLWTSRDVNKRLAELDKPAAFTAELLAVALDGIGMSDKALESPLPPPIDAPTNCPDHDPRPAYESVRIRGTNGKTVPRKVRWGSKCSACRAVTFDAVGEND